MTITENIYNSCNHLNKIYDRYCIICSDCGLILEDEKERGLTPPKKFYFMNQQEFAHKEIISGRIFRNSNRTGPTETKYNSTLEKKLIRRIRNAEKIAFETDYLLGKIINFLLRMNTIFRFHKNIIIEAFDILCKFRKNNKRKGIQYTQLSLACLYWVVENNKCKISFKTYLRTITDLGIKSNLLFKYFNKIKEYMKSNENEKKKNPLFYYITKDINSFFGYKRLNLSLVESLTKYCCENFQGHSPTAIRGALIYIFSKYTFNGKITQREICETLKTTEVSLRTLRNKIEKKIDVSKTFSPKVILL